MPKEKKKKEDKNAKEFEEIKGLLLRVQADFENYRKRTQKEKEELCRYQNTDLLLRIIPVLDNFKLAIAHLPSDMEKNDWVTGVRHIEKQLEQLMTEEGVTEIASKGEKFNPHLHEAVEEVESSVPPGVITEVVRTGYMLGDKVIRCAKVKVSKEKSK